MRELKFRAWDFELKTMHFFNGIFNKHPWTETSTFPQYESCPKMHKVDVMQYTGLKDMNGKEIYELMELDNLYRVIYDCGAYVLQDISNDDIICLLDNSLVKANERKITREYSPMEKNQARTYNEFIP